MSAPKKPLNLDAIRRLLALGVPMAKVARDMGVDVSTIKRRLKDAHSA